MITAEFDALRTPIVLSKKYFLEASAGTGKTFAIEHLLIRLLCHPSQPDISSILVVTFTRAACAELKRRIKKSLSEIVERLSFQTPDSQTYNLPYLEEYLTSPEDVNRIYRQLNTALTDFEFAQIFTIHGFCAEILRKYPEITGFFSSLRQKKIPLSETILLHIRNYFIQNLFLTVLTEESLGKLVKIFPKDLHLQILEYLLSKSPINVSPVLSDEEILSQMKSILMTIKEKLGCTDEKLLFEDLCLQASYFKGLADRHHVLYPETSAGFQNFVKALLEKEPCYLIDSVITKMTKVNQKKSFEKYEHLFVFPDLFPLCEDLGLFELILLYSDKQRILQILGEDIRNYIRSHTPSGEISFPDDLLLMFQKHLDNEQFLHSIREKYTAVFIDEFQDTDKVQWDIFSSLFLSEKYKGTFFLVGDPKQSIYRFRSADIYVYQEAKRCFASSDIYSLQINFRSDPRLLVGLNTLFGKSKDIFHLPKTREVFNYCPLKSGLPDFEDDILPTKKNIHFFFHNSPYEMFQFIEKEILELNNVFHIPLRECAILVKDRYQAAQLAEHFSLPLNIKNPRSLIKSPAFYLLKDLLYALRLPFNHAACLKILMSPLCSYTFQTLLLDRLKISQLFLSYTQILQEKGLLCLFHHMLKEHGDNLLSLSEGASLYADLEQLIEIIENLAETSEDYLSLLNRLEIGGTGDEKFRARTNQEDDAITVITIHSAKGLEYAAVFPIGLVAEKTSKTDQEEIIAEKLRQTYVALTRAKKRLYIPVPVDYTSHPEAPITLFLEKILESTSLNEFLRVHEKIFSYSMADSHHNISNMLKQKESIQLYPPKQLPTFTDRPHKVFSFSSLFSHEDTYILPSIDPTTTVDHFPIGTESGVLIHTLFEKLDFKKIISSSKTSIEILITPFLKNSILEKWTDHIAEMIHRVMHTPLSANGEKFCLCDINPSELLRECEFLFEDPDAGGSFKGFIDLFFRYKNRFYIIDWKTNFIGPSFSDYSQENLIKIANNYHYDQQAAIYKKAALRYLRLFNSSSHWGGNFYLFLRGCNSLGNGVLFFH